MSTPEYWVIWGEAGGHDDIEKWIASIHTTKAEAEAVLAKFEAQREAPEYRLRPHDVTPSRPYMWADYWVIGPFRNTPELYQGEYENSDTWSPPLGEG
jgi:hypothetical protein